MPEADLGMRRDFFALEALRRGKIRVHLLPPTHPETLPRSTTHVTTAHDTTRTHASTCTHGYPPNTIGPFCLTPKQGSDDTACIAMIALAQAQSTEMDQEG
ncbi:uncharacterized protein MYCFIDRAFT_210480 [Pseudocercospora fijiensis CIRAD86]|uniref:Uncharacterized protein n=1 Tax=Pseudocercospora fijiensis (strain CIRAD86) TaxID=383855 RepID=M3AP25_PSEFD|nr:uncharacterized protein MYCFIDRAFT_210480 [Pseudocercospora fijiensis CIRAD86]EME86341.1 hypothetical protein MYCFIDRAFT_210480 [Pseudocercospora fijiensis CIRAD86]